MNNMEIWDFDYKANNIWIYVEDVKALFRIDALSCQIDLVKVLDKSVMNSFRGVSYCDNKIYLAPQNGVKEIYIYDVETQTINRKEISESYCPIGEQHNLFIEIVHYENRVFLIPGRYEAIVCLDLDTGKLSYIDGWYGDIKNGLSSVDNHLVIFNGITRIDESRILINGWKSNVSMIFDMKEMKYRIIHYDNIGKGLRGAIYNDQEALITYKNTEGVYLQNDYSIKRISNMHGRLYAYKNKVYLVDSSLGEIIKFNKIDTDNCTIVYSDIEKNGNTFFLVKQYFNKLVILNSSKNKIIIFDMETDSVSRIDISKLESFSVRIKIDECDGLLFEDEQLDLRKFITTL